MSFLRTLIEGTELRATKSQISPRDPAAWDFLSGGDSTAGVEVSPPTAIRSTAVMAAVRILAQAVASLPLPVFERLKPRGKQRAPEHALHRLLHDAPNEAMASFNFRETLTAHVLLWGNGYAEIERTGAGRIVALWPWAPNRVRVFRLPDLRVGYLVTPNEGPEQKFFQDEVFHVAGLGFDGVRGLSVIEQARDAVGLAIAAEKSTGKFFANDSTPSGTLNHPSKLTDEAHLRLKNSWEAAHRGTDNAHRMAILEEGLKWDKIGISPKDAQFLETRKFQVTEVARMFGVPPHMIGDLDRATFSNIEQQGLDFLTHSVRSWLIRWEQEIHRKLFREAEREKFFAEFIVDGFLRGDSAARSTYYREQFMVGALSQNDIRELENRNPIPGGDTYYVPMNMVDSAAPPALPDPASARSVYQILFRDAVGRVTKRAASTRKATWIAETFWPLLKSIAEHSYNAARASDRFLTGYAEALSLRAQQWEAAAAETITEQELARAIQEIQGSD